jgi:S1-C subfamily serine protease
VAGSPAAKAGLKAGDVVTSFDGHTVSSADDLSAAVAAAKPGETVSVSVQRGGSTKHLSVTLGVQPKSASS